MWLPVHKIVVPLALVAMLCVCVVCRLLLRDRSEKLRRIPFVVLVSLLLAGEVAKQIVGLARGYDLYFLPVHFSSSFYVCLSFAAFGRGGLRRFGFSTAFVCGAFTTVTLLASPLAVVGPLDNIASDYVAFHSLFFHLFLVQFWLLGFALGCYAPARRDYPLFCVYLGAWGLVAVPLANVFRINYAGLLESYIPFLEAVRTGVGYWLFLLCYAALALAVSLLLLWVCRAVRARLDRARADCLRQSSEVLQNSLQK